MSAWAERASAAVEQPREARSDYRVEAPRGGVVVTWVGGRLVSSVAEALRFDFAAATVRAHEGGRGERLAAFHDWEQLVGYEGDARGVLARLLNDGRGAFETTHILLGTSPVGMGIGVTASLLGKVRCHARRDAWAQALASWPEPVIQP